MLVYGAQEKLRKHIISLIVTGDPLILISFATGCH